MITTIASGKNYQVNDAPGGTWLRLFQVDGTKEDGVTESPDEIRSKVHDPRPISVEIRRNIQLLDDAGIAGDIRHLEITAEAAIRLFQEGFLKPELFATATEEVDLVVIKDFQFDGRTFDLLIKEDDDFDVVFTDASGNLL